MQQTGKRGPVGLRLPLVGMGLTILAASPGPTGLASLFGARPLAGRRLRAIAVPATFLAIWGALMAVAFIVDLGVSMGHFDTGTPSDEQALIDAGLVVSAIGGAILGAIAALAVRARIGRDMSHNG